MFKKFKICKLISKLMMKEKIALIYKLLSNTFKHYKKKLLKQRE